MARTYKLPGNYNSWLEVYDHVVNDVNLGGTTSVIFNDFNMKKSKKISLQYIKNRAFDELDHSRLNEEEFNELRCATFNQYFGQTSSYRRIVEKLEKQKISKLCGRK